MSSIEAFDHIKKEHLHHAYVVEASQAEGFAALRALMESFDIPIKGNPDFHEYVFDNFLLDHAHVLRHEQSMRGAEGAKKIFLVAFNTILHEAQNALLKTLEEPTEGTHFFFVTRTSEVLLPTLRSRMQIVSSQSLVPSGQSLGNAGEEFLGATISERLKMIEPMVKAKADDKSEAKERARAFLESLEHALYEQSFGGDTTESTSFFQNGVPLEKISRSLAAKGVSSKTFSRSFAHVLFAKRTLSERSPSVKLLLEHLALTVPQTR